MWIDALDWLELTYPIGNDWNGSAAERAEEAERICLRRLETIRWPDGPECPKCGARDDATKWTGAPRGVGWRCCRCKTRFHVLQVIPPMARTHHPAQLWFRAIFLFHSTPKFNSCALGRELGLEQKTAWKLGRAVRILQINHPTLAKRIVGGPTADNQVRRKRKKRAPATTLGSSINSKDLSSRPLEPGCVVILPGAFDADC
jgi:hypothetical protein